MPAFFWDSTRAFRVSVAKFLVEPWAASFRAAGPALCEMRNSWSSFTSLPFMLKERLRVKTNEVVEDTEVLASARSAASWDWRALSWSAKDRGVVTEGDGEDAAGVAATGPGAMP